MIGSAGRQSLPKGHGTPSEPPFPDVLSGAAQARRRQKARPPSAEASKRAPAGSGTAAGGVTVAPLPGALTDQDSKPPPWVFFRFRKKIAGKAVG
jgi:hypothetical protein